MSQLNKYKVMQLRAILTDKKLNPKGKKNLLLQRLAPHASDGAAAAAPMAPPPPPPPPLAAPRGKKRRNAGALVEATSSRRSRRVTVRPTLGAELLQALNESATEVCSLGPGVTLFTAPAPSGNEEYMRIAMDEDGWTRNGSQVLVKSKEEGVDDKMYDVYMRSYNHKVKDSVRFGCPPGDMYGNVYTLKPDGEKSVWGLRADTQLPKFVADSNDRPKLTADLS